jgi:hypothetical protein
MSTPPTLSRSGYAVGSPTRTCAATGRALTTGETYVAALVQVPETEDYRRVDLSLDAWKAGARPRGENGARLAVLGSWRGVVPEPGAKKRILIDDESLLDLFEQSDEQAAADAAAESADASGQVSAEDRLAFRFMLALILLRKKLLVAEKTGKNGSMFVRPRGSPKVSEGGVLTEVKDPGLSEDSISRVVVQLSALLDGEVVPPAPGAAATPGVSA